MTRHNDVSRPTRWERIRFRLTLAVLVIFYAVGASGILSRHSEVFVRLSFANLVLTAALLLANAERFDRSAASAFLLCAIVGFSVEALGVETGVIFGEYHYTNRMGPSLFGVPVVIGLNWAVLIHAVHGWLGKRFGSRTLMAALGATVMTALDAVMEPVALRLRFWVWQGDSVPLRNYLAWWSVSFVLLLVSDALSPRPSNRLARWVLGVMLVFFGTLGAMLP